MIILLSFQIVTDQSTGQKIQIVTALEQGSGGKQQFILANADYSTAGKVILAKQEASSPGKVILAAPDGSGVNQLLFASPDLAGQQIQVEASACTTNILVSYYLLFRILLSTKFWFP